MATPDQARISADRAKPRLMELWWALQPLKSIVRFMQTGAHPDDEISGMLAALAFRDGINISYACSTRGEGGQNDIGTEAGADLGALRTREMERACDVLGMRMYWHGETPEDTITDFGFSKSGVETLGRWKHHRTLARFVEIVRTEKPDIICPTFLDVPGQHGHHRAMTQAAHEVMSAAADPGFPSNLPPWQVKKLYLPAWSGAGQAYDDDLPPPPATLVIEGTDGEEISGWPWERIGQQSRAYHRTQGMGRWVPAGKGHDWPLHLVESHVSGPDDALWSGLPKKVGDLAAVAGEVAPYLISASNAIDEAVEAFPDIGTIEGAVKDAMLQLLKAQKECSAEVASVISHHLAAKMDQLGHVLNIASGTEVRVRPSDTILSPGHTTRIAVEAHRTGNDGVNLGWKLPTGWSIDGDQLSVGPNAAIHDPYADTYDPRRPAAPHAVVDYDIFGERISVPFAWDAVPVILPAERARVEPSSVLLNAALDKRSFDIGVSDIHPGSADVRFSLPTGWSSKRTDTGFSITVPTDAPHGHQTLTATIGGNQVQTVRVIDHDHIAPTARARSAEVHVSIVDVAIPKARVGYVGAGNDRVGHWLHAIGADVTELSNADLKSDATLAAYDTIVIGIFAMRFRRGLVEAMPRLHRWTEAGGTLLTLYHRPWDNWDPDRIPPKRLEIGKPSLRWRVTDETAEVTHLEDHPILSFPNPIGPKDWDGWVKERGLYFAKSWDPAYTPLLSMADPEEEPLNGSLLVANVGAGRHIHTSLILHHQMEHLVGGAFRLMANFIAPRE